MRALLVKAMILVALSSINASAADIYICPPCGGVCDTLRFDKPGNCTGCGMPLVKTSEIRDVVIFVFDEVETLDMAGPYDAFHAGGGLFRVTTVAKDTSHIFTTAGLSIRPAHTFADCPPAQVFVIPGGGVGGVLSDSASMAFVRRMVEASEVTLSVCSGAFVLARAGLLDGLTATCHRGDIEELRREAPRTTVVNDRRWVDNGKIITAAGVSSGIDAALHVIERLHGDDVASSTEEYLEFDRRDQ